MDEYIEIYAMMKEDPMYDNEDVQQHLADGVKIEDEFNKLTAYMQDFRIIHKWIVRTSYYHRG